MDRSAFGRYFRIAFIILSGLIVVTGVVYFILGNIHFGQPSKWYYSGSFIGGHMAAIGLLFVVYGLLGLYAAYKRERVALMIFGSIATVSLITRILMWVLAAMHGYRLEAYNYAFVALELALMLLSALMIYIFN